MADIASVRASAAPLAFRCPASARAASVPINETHEASDVGSAAHEALRPLAETGAVNWDAVPAIAEENHAPLDEVRMLCALGAKLWPSVSQSFTNALTEVEFSVEVAPGFTLTGHVDLLSVSGTVARAGDWKTGRKDQDHSHQMRAYGALVLLDDPELTEVTVTVIWVRDGEIENYTMTHDDAHAWLKSLVATVVEWDGVYHPGSHCTYCPRSHECPAANALVRRDVAALSDRELVERAECELELMATSEIIELHQKADLVSKYAERVRAAIKSHVLKCGEVVANGVRLTIETDTRRELDPLKAWPVLESAGFEDEDFSACMDLRISKIEKRIAQKAGRGKGAAAVRALGAELESARALRTNQTTKLAQKRA